MTRKRSIGLVVALLALTGGLVFARTDIQPGFNIFSIEQDKDIGRQSAAEAEKQLPILNNRQAEQYVNTIGSRLAAVSRGAKFDYHFKIVDASDINAFALPGGYMYLNRGLIEAVSTEGQLAGVMAHEMAHVALRHGTNQASKAYLGQAGLGLFGGLVGRRDGSASKVIGAVGGFGLNALFLKFSRTDEEQADVVGAQMLAKAGYDPMEMVTFFKMLKSKGDREPGKVQQFFSSHPEPGDRATRVRQEAKTLTIRPGSPVGGLETVQATFRRMPPAPSMQQIAQGKVPTTTTTTRRDTGVDVAAIAAPSSQYRVFQQRGRFFRIDYPDNWQVYEPAYGNGVTIAPEGGFVDAGGSERDLIYGVIVNHYDPFNEIEEERFGDRRAGENWSTDLVGPNGTRSTLSNATSDLVATIVKTNPELRLVPGSQRNDQIDGAPAMSVVLTGRSSLTRRDEQVTLFTRGLPDGHVIYALFIAPGRSSTAVRQAFDRMFSSLQVNDQSAHR